MTLGLPAVVADKIAFAGPRECWRWTASKNGDGYGQIRRNGKTLYAHRVVYTILVGPIPDGLQLDHVKKWGCLHRDCVNPRHLQPVTFRENIERAPNHNLEKTACPEGHPLDDENTYVYPDGRRECRICRRAYMAAYYRRHRAS